MTAPEHDDDDAAHVGQGDLVRPEDATDARGGGTERHEDEGETGDEEADAPQHGAQGGRRESPLRPPPRARWPRAPRRWRRSPAPAAARRVRRRRGSRPRRRRGPLPDRPRWPRVQQERGARCPPTTGGSWRTMSMSASTIIVTRLGEVDLGAPAQHLARLGRLADQQVDLGRAQEALVDDDVLLPVEPGRLEGQPAQLAHLVGLPGRDDVVAGRVLLEHEPHGAHVVGGVAPVALARRDCPSASFSSSLCAMRATPCVTLRVTNSRPRRGDSWLNRMPDEACRCSSRGS